MAVELIPHAIAFHKLQRKIVGMYSIECRRAIELDPRSEEAEAALAKVEATIAAACLRHELRGHVGIIHCLAFIEQVKHDLH